MRSILSSRTTWEELGEEGFRYLLASYYALIEGIDEEIGRVVEELKRLGIDDNTTIFFTSDHGDEAGHHGLYMKFRDVCSTALTQVPLLVRPARKLCPEGPAKTRRTEPVELIDLPPTILSLLGCTQMEGVEGQDLSEALLEDGELDPGRPVFCEDIEGRMILHENRMLAFYEHDSQYCQLYELESDPGQYRNLYRDSSVIDRRIDLKRRLIAFLSQRQYGTFSEEDVATIKRCLDPEDPMVPLHTWYTSPHGRTIDQCRCALFLHGEGEKFFIPFYDDEDILYFHDSSDKKDHMRFIYPTRDIAVPCEKEKIEEALDEILCLLISRTHTVSVLKRHVRPS
jgi:hypothetical protein